MHSLYNCVTICIVSEKMFIISTKYSFSAKKFRKKVYNFGEMFIISEKNVYYFGKMFIISEKCLYFRKNVYYFGKMFTISSKYS